MPTRPRDEEHKERSVLGISSLLSADIERKFEFSLYKTRWSNDNVSASDQAGRGSIPESDQSFEVVKEQLTGLELEGGSWR